MQTSSRPAGPLKSTRRRAARRRRGGARRVVDAFAKRLQVQEKLTAQIAGTIWDALKPQGVAVILNCQHFCMCYRGVRKPGSWTTTSKLHGCFLSNEACRQELMTLIPVLQALGVPNETILKNLVRVYSLTEEFLPSEQPAMPNAPQQSPGSAQQAPAMLPEAGVAPGELPAPGQVKAMLPDGGVV